MQYNSKVMGINSGNEHDKLDPGVGGWGGGGVTS